MSLISVGLGVAGSLLGGGGPSYANGLRRVSAWRKEALGGNVASAQRLVAVAGLQGNKGSQYSETRAAARAALAELALSASQSDVRAVAAGALSGVGVNLTSSQTPNGGNMGTPTLGQPSNNLPNPGGIMASLSAWWPWLLVGALLLLILWRK